MGALKSAGNVDDAVRIVDELFKAMKCDIKETW